MEHATEFKNATMVYQAVSPVTRSGDSGRAKLSEISRVVIETALLERDPMACGLCILQLAHGPDSLKTGALIHCLDESISRCASRFEFETAAALSMLGRRKSQVPKPKPQRFMELALEGYLNIANVVENPSPAAIVALFSTVDPADPLADIAHSILRQANSFFLQRLDLPRASLAVFGASPFLTEGEVKHVLELICAAYANKAVTDIELNSYFLLAAHFGRHLAPIEAMSIIKTASVLLEELIIRTDWNFSCDRNRRSHRHINWSVVSTDLALVTLGLVALHQIGRINLNGPTAETEMFVNL
jgi:hypothetical protein